MAVCKPLIAPLLISLLILNLAESYQQVNVFPLPLSLIYCFLPPVDKPLH